MWCSPRGPVDPMYMPGRLRTASRPSSTVMSLAPYVPPLPLGEPFAAVLVFFSAKKSLPSDQAKPRPKWCVPLLGAHRIGAATQVDIRIPVPAPENGSGPAQNPCKKATKRSAVRDLGRGAAFG